MPSKRKLNSFGVRGRDRSGTIDVQQVHLKCLAMRDQSQTMQTLREGLKTRMNASTTRNDRSSRSHFIVVLKMVQPDRKQWSTLFLCDLAGSEEAWAISGGNKSLFAEGVKTNSDLHHLGRMVRMRASRYRYVPHRDTQVRRGEANTYAIHNTSTIAA